ncbi:MAG: complex I subunit 5 family protein, partial [Lachnospiraceae bacterium]
MSGWILLPVLLPVLAGACMLGSSAVSKWKGRPQPDAASLRRLHLAVCGVLSVSAVLALLAAWSGEHEVTLFYLMKDIPVYFRIDEIGRLFVTVISIVWVAVGIYSCVYMRHEGEEKRFFGFYLIVYSVLIALSFAGNLVTMYLFYELMTLASMPMVLHNGSREAIMAALKYLFYSMCGAYMGLFGIYFLYQYTDTLTFTAGGTLDMTRAAGHEGVLLVAVFVMLLGFGAKAGMFPLHAWLPTAHPVAPSPASAVFSGVIVKCGVLAAIRTVYY